MPQPTAWGKHFFILVEANRLKLANNLAAQWDPDTGGAQTFGPMLLSPTGQETVTNYATSTRATETMRHDFDLDDYADYRRTYLLERREHV